MNQGRKLSTVTEETAPLLNDEASSTAPSQNYTVPITEQRQVQSQDERNGLLLGEKDTIESEIKYMIKNSIPVLVTFMMQYLIQIMIPIYFSSKLGPDYLSACNLSLTIFYISGPVIFNGFTTALDTLCSTAFGAEHYQQVGLFYQQCTIILVLLVIPQTILWLNCSHVISLLSDDPELVELCSRYMQMMPFAAPAVAVFECSKRFLQSQNKFSVPTRITILAAPLSVVLNWQLGPMIGFYGPPVSFVITVWFMAITLLLYIFLIDGYQCWNNDWNIKTLFSNWSIFFKLGVPGVLMLHNPWFKHLHHLRSTYHLPLLSVVPQE
ncbi:unnamed protein product [Ambrosiozyma monospora]|uniref:Unnamed protein product n=1 Tax=Ambrosiozyma monospora TaxID=43982 RepID=A0ACB5T686_AMBMO|nr:unnamed protein product [Ambrosiozyma monospora]